MLIYRCVIVEDSPLAAEHLQELVGGVEWLQLEATCADAFSAIDFLQKNPVDLIFLDINLPKMTGLEMLRHLPHPPKVIITTAYPNYAAEGFDLDVLDYLLKPIEDARFLQAVGKLTRPILPRESAATQARISPERPFYFFHVNRRSVKIYLDEISCIESINDAVWIHTGDQKFQTNYQISELERILPENNFLRIHRSYLVALDKISSANALEVKIGRLSFPIGRTYKKFVAGKLK